MAELLGFAGGNQIIRLLEAVETKRLQNVALGKAVKKMP